MYMKRFVSLLLTLSLLCGFVYAAPEAFQIADVYVMEGDVRIPTQAVNGKCCLFLPPTMSAEAAPLRFDVNRDSVLYSVRGDKGAVGTTDGASLDLTALCSEAPYCITVQALSGESRAEISLYVVPTSGTSAMFLTSEDPVNKGREWVEASPTKDNKAKGEMLLVNELGETVYDGALTQIKGRGNSTWLADKKPYQIKLSEKADLLETGKDENASKTWVLLTNHSDESLLRSKLVYDLSVAMGMQPGIECRMVDLFYDGEYRGVYLLCEKVEIGSGRVNISDLEGEFEDANPDIDFDALTTAVGKTENGASYVYCPDLKNPEDLTGGYLLEIDTPVRAQAEKCYLVTTRNTHVVVKSPEFGSKEAMAYIASCYQEFEDTLYNAGVHPTNGKILSDYINIDSLAQCYLINELTKNPDSYRTSCYFYKDAASDILTAGPVWDYDLSFGIGWGEFVNSCADPEGYFALLSGFGKALYAVPSVRVAARELWCNTLSKLVTETTLPSLAEARQALALSANANAMIWNRSISSWEASCDALYSYIQTRNAWLTGALSQWNADSAESVEIYHDVADGAWYYDSVISATNYGLMTGMGYSIFQPDGTGTRAQTAQVLYEMAKGTAPAYRAVFSDVPAGEWYTNAVLWAQENGVASGYEDGTFCPNREITRQEMISLLYRYLGSPKVAENALADFADKDAVAPWAAEAMNWAVSVGVVYGYEDQTLRPLNTVTRAELAALIVRYYEQFISIPEK